MPVHPLELGSHSSRDLHFTYDWLNQTQAAIFDRVARSIGGRELFQARCFICEILKTVSDAIWVEIILKTLFHFTP